tara:strand:+ start:8947 stop:10746 length:1800 start_codon:yes stop_codon:yes gene_type:complete
LADEFEDSRGLIELLVESGKLPSFDLPVDVVCFESQYKTRKFTNSRRHAMSQSLSSAMGQWLPGRRLVVEKIIYEIYGLLVPYVPSDVNETVNDGNKLNRFNYFMNQPGNEKFLVLCGICNHVLDNNDQPISMLDPAQKEIAVEGGQCPTCNSENEFLELRWIKPPGYGPKVMVSGNGNGNQEPKREDSQFGKNNQSGNSGRVRWPIQYGADSANYEKIRTIEKDKILGVRRTEGLQRLTQIVGEPWAVDGSEIDEYGFQICENCGAFNQNSSHERPYPVIGLKSEEEKENWKKNKSVSCTGEALSLLLGRPFQSSILSISIPLGGKLINPIDFIDGTRETRRIKSSFETAGFTLGRVIIDEVCKYHRLKDDEFDCDVRFNRISDETNLEIFFFETSDGGSGNLESFWPFILGMFAEDQYIQSSPQMQGFEEDSARVCRSVEDRLNGSSCKVLVPNEDGKFDKYESYACEKACNGCLLDYRNSASERRLHREKAYHLFLYMQGRLDDLQNPSKLNLSSALIQFSNRIREEEDWGTAVELENGKFVRVKITDDLGESVVVEAVSDLINPVEELEIERFAFDRLIRNPDPVLDELEELFDL